jgi:hypothetical protein
MKAIAAALSVALVSVPAVYAQPYQTQLNRQEEANARAAWTQLRRVLSAVEAGVSYIQYSDLVVQTKMNTDPLIESLSSLSSIYTEHGNVKEHLKAAMEDLIKAREAFRGSIEMGHSSRFTSEYKDQMNEYWNSAAKHLLDASLILKTLSNSK